MSVRFTIDWNLDALHFSSKNRYKRGYGYALIISKPYTHLKIRFMSYDIRQVEYPNVIYLFDINKKDDGYVRIATKETQYSGTIESNLKGLLSNHKDIFEHYAETGNVKWLFCIIDEFRHIFKVNTEEYELVDAYTLYDIDDICSPLVCGLSDALEGIDADGRERAISTFIADNEYIEPTKHNYGMFIFNMREFIDELNENI